MELKEQIKTARKLLKINQIQLAIIMGVNKQTVSNWETGVSTPDLKTLKTLGKKLQTKFTI